MGEAKSRRSRLAALQATQPFCIYCGGSTHGNTIDHMPPITVFDQRRRPKGLEFLSCNACNSGGRGAEQVVGYLSRLYPDATTSVGQLESRKILQAIKNNHPGLLSEMLPSAEQQRRFQRHSHRVPGAGVLNVGGPLVNAAVQSFGGKLGFAMHFQLTGRVVPTAGCVGVRWYSNYDAMTGTLPSDFLTTLGPPETLRQGRFEVSEQFSVSSVVAIGNRLSGHFATFRKSFAVVAAVAEDQTKLNVVPNTHKVRPGWLKKMPIQ